MVCYDGEVLCLCLEGGEGLVCLVCDCFGGEVFEDGFWVDLCE